MIDMALFFCFKHTTFIQHHDYYCYCKKLLQKENDVVLKLRYKSDRCQICKIPPMFYDFGRDINKKDLTWRLYADIMTDFMMS